MEIGIRQADGSFVPVITQGEAAKKRITLSPAKEGQESAHILLYTGEDGQLGQFVSTLDVQELEEDISLVLELDESGKLAATATSGNNSYYTDVDADFIPGSIPVPDTGSDITVDSLSSNEDFDLSDDLDANDESMDLPTVDSILAENGTTLEESIENSDDMFGDIESESLDIPADEQEINLEDDLAELSADTPSFDEDETIDLDLPSFDNEVSDENELPSFGDEASEESELPSFDEDTSDDSELPSFDDEASDDSELPSFDEDASDESELPSFDEDTSDDSELPSFDDEADSDDFGLPDMDSGMEINLEDNDDSLSVFPDAETEEDTGLDFSIDEPTGISDEADLPDFDANDELPDLDVNPDDDLASLSFDSSDEGEQADENLFTDTSPAGDTDFSMDDDSAFSTDFSMDEEESTSSFENDFSVDEDESIFADDDTNTAAFGGQSGFESDGHIEVEEPYHVAPPKQEKSNILLFLLGGIAIGAVITALLLFFVFNNNQTPAAVENPTSENTTDAPSTVTLDQPMPADATSMPDTGASVSSALTPEETQTQPSTTPTGRVDVYYTINWGDTLWDLAWSFYQDPNLYKAIVNQNAIHNPDVIKTGARILIPDVEYNRD